MPDNVKTGVPYPGHPNTCDGSYAVAYVETRVTTGTCAYPITPSTNMGAYYDLYRANGGRNLWGDELVFIEPESEHSAATACEGYALAGGRVTNFTSGQGLILMKEVLYTISGKRLPAVFHIGARALTSHSLNIHAGHDDVCGCADCGWGIIFGRNTQEAMDFSAICRRVAEECCTPFLNVQDGFITTHTIQNVFEPEDELLREFVGDPKEKLVNLFDPTHPVMSGVVQNQDSYMTGKIAQRQFYSMLHDSLKSAFKLWGEKTGRVYDLIIPFNMEDAEYAIVAAGSMAESAEATAAFLRKKYNRKVGVISLVSYRPFPGAELVSALKNVKAFAVLERMDNPVAQDNPITAEIKAAFADSISGREGFPKIDRIPTIYSGSAGMGGRDVRGADFIAVFDHMAANNTKRWFSLGIQHESSLERTEDPDLRTEGAFSMRGHSVGGYGSVTTNKIIADLVADVFGLKVQAFPKYGSEKRGTPTNYFLTVQHEPVRTHFEIKIVDFVAIQDKNAFMNSNPLAGLQKGGIVFVSCPDDEIDIVVPSEAKRKIAELGCKLYQLDTQAIARDIASNPALELRMMGIALLGVFLRYAPFTQKIGEDEVFKGVEKSIRKAFGRKSEQIVEENMKAIRRGFTEAHEIKLEGAQSAS